MTDWKDLRRELLADPETKREYDKLAPKYALISEVISARIKANLTQKELAERAGIKQSAIARLEGGNSNPTFEFLQKVAQSLGLSVHLSK